MTDQDEPHRGEEQESPRQTGDDVVDAALSALPTVPSDEVDVDLEGPISQVTEVHRRLQQRLSDLSR